MDLSTILLKFKYESQTFQYKPENGKCEIQNLCSLMNLILNVPVQDHRKK